jgi:hypothetical protein
MIASTGCGRRAQSPSTFCGANETTRVAKCVKDRTQIGGGLIPAADGCPVLPIFQDLDKAGHSHRRRRNDGDRPTGARRLEGIGSSRSY